MSEPNKPLSGAAKRKIKDQKEKETAKLRLQATHFFKAVEKTSDKHPTEEIEIDIQNEGPISSASDTVVPMVTDEVIFPTSSQASSSSSQTIDLNEFEDKSGLDASDPSTWPVPLSDSIRGFLIQSGPQQKIISYPERDGNSFNSSFFQGSKKNGEPFHREWLIFSEKSISIFCFPCTLFGTRSTPWGNYGGEGFHDFRNKGRSIIFHENSQAHFNNNISWKKFVCNLQSGRTIDSLNQAVLQSNISHWKDVLKAILDAVLFLAKNNLAFRGESSNIQDNNCGNFLSLIKLLSKYYPPLTRHVSKLKKGNVSYLSPNIQNEFINLCGAKIRQAVLNTVKSRKYYSIMFDSTPDTARQEQINQIIRTVKCGKDGCQIEEMFVDFISSTKKKGEDMSKIIVDKLQNDGLDINNIRGQGYDNASNMSGIYKGVQKWIFDKNNLAHYIPCAAHSLNLVGVNSAEKVQGAKLALGQIQNIFAFFSSSPARWELLSSKLKVSLKGQSTTRWSARAQAVNALRYQYADIIEVLIEMLTSDFVDFNSQTMASADSMLKNMLNFKFLISVVIWDNVLFKFDICNRSIQGKHVNIETAEKLLSGLADWLTEFKLDGFENCHTYAKEVAENCGIEPESGFSDVRLQKRRKRLIEEDETSDASLAVSNIKRFETEFFDSLIDNLLAAISQRFKQIKSFSDDFGFLWGDKLQDFTELEQEKHAKDLCLKYPDDLDMPGFINEVKFLKHQTAPFLNKKEMLKKLGPLDMLNLLYHNGLENAFSNVEIALRIFLTLPVTVASNERAFSKLKIIKNYMRSAMGQERLTSLAIISIEYVLADGLDFDEIIHTFANAKCRKIEIKY